MSLVDMYVTIKTVIYVKEKGARKPRPGILILLEKWCSLRSPEMNNKMLFMGGFRDGSVEKK